MKKKLRPPKVKVVKNLKQNHQTQQVLVPKHQKNSLYIVLLLSEFQVFVEL